MMKYCSELQLYGFVNWLLLSPFSPLTQSCQPSASLGIYLCSYNPMDLWALNKLSDQDWDDLQHNIGVRT